MVFEQHINEVLDVSGLATPEPDDPQDVVREMLYLLRTKLPMHAFVVSNDEEAYLVYPLWGPFDCISRMVPLDKYIDLLEDSLMEEDDIFCQIRPNLSRVWTSEGRREEYAFAYANRVGGRGYYARLKHERDQHVEGDTLWQAINFAMENLVEYWDAHEGDEA